MADERSRELYRGWGETSSLEDGIAYLREVSREGNFGYKERQIAVGFSLDKDCEPSQLELLAGIIKLNDDQQIRTLPDKTAIITSAFRDYLRANEFNLIYAHGEDKDNLVVDMEFAIRGDYETDDEIMDLIGGFECFSDTSDEVDNAVAYVYCGKKRLIEGNQEDNDRSSQYHGRDFLTNCGEYSIRLVAITNQVFLEENQGSLLLDDAEESLAQHIQDHKVNMDRLAKAKFGQRISEGDAEDFHPAGNIFEHPTRYIDGGIEDDDDPEEDDITMWAY